MRRAVLARAVSLGLACGGVAAPAAAQAFQGTIKFTIHGEDGRTTEITQLTRPGKTAFLAAESGKPGGGMIVDSTAGTMTVLDGTAKTYMVISLAMMQQMAGMARGMSGMTHRGTDSTGQTDRIKGTLTPTGRSEVVAGVTCQVYTYDGMNEGRHATGEVCLARGAGLMASGPMNNLPGMFGMQARQSMQQRLQDWGPLGALIAQGYGLLKATNYEDGKLQGSLEVTAFQRGAPPAAAFQPPAGYTEKSMGDMMGGSRPH